MRRAASASADDPAAPGAGDLVAGYCRGLIHDMHVTDVRTILDAAPWTGDPASLDWAAGEFRRTSARSERYQYQSRNFEMA